MRRICRPIVFAAIVILTATVLAQRAPTDGPYKILKTAKVGGDGGFDYIFADVEARRLYIPRNGPMGHLMVFNLDTLEPAAEIANVIAEAWRGREDRGAEERASRHDRAAFLTIEELRRDPHLEMHTRGG